jgi:hypothetical protein
VHKELQEKILEKARKGKEKEAIKRKLSHLREKITRKNLAWTKQGIQPREKREKQD